MHDPYLLDNHLINFARASKTMPSFKLILYNIDYLQMSLLH